MDAPAVPSLRVNGVVADFGSETLRDAAGGAIPLRPRSFAVLRHLVANAGRLVTKDELMAAVWPGLAVTDDSLVQCIHDIRRAIGDEAHAVLRTVPRRGYRLVLPERPTARPWHRWADAAGAAALPSFGAAGARWRGWPARWLALALGATMLVVGVVLVWWSFARPEKVDAAIDGPPVVAVVPFVNVAGDEASKQLALGFGKHFFTDLAHYREFQVVGRSATYVYQDQPAGALEVHFVLGGWIDRVGDRLRITAQLSDVRTGDVLWSERWDRPDRDVAAAQAEISEQISNRLGGGTGVIQDAGRAIAKRKRPGDLTAHERYLLATEQLALATRAGAAEAVALLSRAVELDPAFARAWVELSLAHATLADFRVDPEGNRRQAVETAEQAVFLDPGDAWAHAAHGVALRHGGELMRARSELDTALLMARNAAEILTLYAGGAATAGEPERGAAIADRVVRLDPGFPPRAAVRFAHAYFMAGRYRAALAMIDRLTPDSYTPPIRVMHAAALAAVGRPEDAAAGVARALEAEPELSIEAMASAPGYGDAERRRLIETMRLAGFPPCAAPEVLATMENPRRLPECEARAEAARPPADGP